VRDAKGGGVALVAHPDTPARAVKGVACTFVWRQPGEWTFDFVVNAPPGALRLPAPAPPDRTDGLWHHTCFEVFLRDPADGAYLEFNLSPSGQWAAYQFEGYRAGMRELDVPRPSIIGSAVPTNVPVFSLIATFEHASLWRGLTVRAAVSAVIEEADGTKSYWALAHPPGKPDFHHADGFALELAPAQ
jgi:hypothetical protein